MLKKIVMALTLVLVLFVGASSGFAADEPPKPDPTGASIGTAADVVKLAMTAVQDWLLGNGLASRLVLQVHDELVLEVPEAEMATVQEALPRLMAGVAQLADPLAVWLQLLPRFAAAMGYSPPA